MTVTATATFHSYKPAAAMAAEALAGIVFSVPGDLVVTHVADATGVRTALSEGVHYTIGGSPATGTATIAALGTWPDDDLFEIERVTTRQQQGDFPVLEPTSPLTIEAALDRLSKVDQEQDRAIGLAQDDASHALELTEQLMGLPGYYPTIAAALADPALLVGKRFTSDESGAMVFYQREAADPFYLEVDGVVTRSQLTAADGAAKINYQQKGAGAQIRPVRSVLREEASLWDVIPPALHDAIMAGAYNDPLDMYVQQALLNYRRINIRDGDYPISGDLLVTIPGQRLVFESERAVLRQIDQTKHLFKVRADGVAFEGGKWLGCAAAATSSRFAVFTEAAFPAQDVSITDAIFSGVDTAKGFTNIAKADTGSHRMRLRGGSIDRLQGNVSGFGYGLLVGASEGCDLENVRATMATGRGRHIAYFSAGASYCRARSNYITGGDQDPLTVYAIGAQPTCFGNEIRDNILIDCAQGGFGNAAVSVFEDCTATVVSGNLIRGSGGCGVRVTSYGSDLMRLSTLADNRVLDSAYIGLELMGLTGGAVRGNIVSESGRAAAGTYSNIRLISDGTRACSDLLIEGNTSSGSLFARSALQINATAPLPTRNSLTIRNNRFSQCHLTDIELGGAAIPINGRIAAADGTFNPPGIAAGTTYTTTVSLPGLRAGDTVFAAHSPSTSAGITIEGAYSADDTALLALKNPTAGAVDAAAGTLLLWANCAEAN